MVLPALYSALYKNMKPMMKRKGTGKWIRKVKSEMENKNETMKELDLNQMEQISGGAAKIRVCPIAASNSLLK